jgi:hypothetical protein
VYCSSIERTSASFMILYSTHLYFRGIATWCHTSWENCCWNIIIFVFDMSKKSRVGRSGLLLFFLLSAKPKIVVPGSFSKFPISRQSCQTFRPLNMYLLLLRPKKKICVFTVTRPTLIFASDPINFLHRIQITIFVV